MAASQQETSPDCWLYFFLDILPWF